MVDRSKDLSTRYHRARRWRPAWSVTVSARVRCAQPVSSPYHGGGTTAAVGLMRSRTAAGSPWGSRQAEGQCGRPWRAGEGLELERGCGGRSGNGLLPALTILWGAEEGQEAAVKQHICNRMRNCMACRARVLQDEEEIFGVRTASSLSTFGERLGPRVSRVCMSGICVCVRLAVYLCTLLCLYACACLCVRARYRTRRFIRSSHTPPPPSTHLQNDREGRARRASRGVRLCAPGPPRG